MTVTVYGKPGCQPCKQTEKRLVAQGTNFDKVDITQDPAAYELITGLGYMQAPVVVVRDAEGNESHWSGFSPDKIKSLSA